MNKTKLTIYLAKSGLIELATAFGIWAESKAVPSQMMIAALVARALLQMSNTWGSFLSDPNGSKNGHVANGATAKPVVESPAVEPVTKA